MQATNKINFTATNGLSFLAGELFNVLAKGEGSAWLEHTKTGARCFVGTVFYSLRMTEVA